MRRVLLLALVLAWVGQLGLGPAGPARGDDEEPLPLDGLNDDELARFQAGRDAFTFVHDPSTGLGPLFNGRSCAECHSQPGAGGSNATLDHQVLLFGRSNGAGGFDPLTAQGGPLRGQRSVREVLPPCTLSPERVPREANVKAHRQPAPLYGLGLIEAIPDEVIRAQVEIGRAAEPGEINGRVNLVDGKVGRFGWKAQAATLRQFVALALLDEIGVTTPDQPREIAPQGSPIPAACDPATDPEDDGSRLTALVDFVQLLAPRGRESDSNAVQHGEQVFDQLGCTACHTPSLTTGPNPIEALSERDVPLYSDLLIHDLGEYLNDDVVQGQAGGSDWRTTPLWGLAAKRLYLHDGRTDDLRQVIEYHSGEARSARQRFRQASRREVNDLLAFLRSL